MGNQIQSAMTNASASLASGQNEPLGTSSQFEVTFHGGPERGYSGKMGAVIFNSCTGLNTEVGVHYIGDAQSGMGLRAVRSNKITGKISFSKSISTNISDLTQWMLDVINPEKRLKKMNLYVVVRSSQDSKKVYGKWRVENAWPCAWSGPSLDSGSTGLALETITFVHEGIIPVSE